MVYLILNFLNMHINAKTFISKCGIFLISLGALLGIKINKNILILIFFINQLQNFIHSIIFEKYNKVINTKFIKYKKLQKYIFSYYSFNLYYKKS